VVRSGVRPHPRPLSRGRERGAGGNRVPLPTGPVPVETGLATNAPGGNRFPLPTGPVPVEKGLATMQPIYTRHNTNSAYQLNWGMTVFWRQPPVPDDHWLSALQRSTEPDGVRILRHRAVGNDASQFFVSTQPHVASPTSMASGCRARPSCRTTFT
jgi:hypothetical protein